MAQQITPERRLGFGILAGTIAGLVTGIGARIAMRIVALNSNQTPGFSIGGTLNILFIGTIAGLFLGLFISAICVPLIDSPRKRKYVPGPVVRGVLVSIILFLLVGLPNFLNTAPDNDLSLGPPYLGRSLFGALFLVFGLTLGISEWLLQHYWPRPSMSPEAEKVASEGKTEQAEM